MKSTNIRPFNGVSKPLKLVMGAYFVQRKTTCGFRYGSGKGTSEAKKKQRAQPYLDTPPKINIEPENDGLEDDFPFPGWYSQVPC